MNYSKILPGIFCLLFFSIGCVSVDLSKSKVQRADDVQFIAPPAPFQSESSKNVDRIWRHKSNGNAISFVSDCGNPYDPSLVSIEHGVVSGLENLKLKSTEKIRMNQRGARKSLYTGEVDGVPTRVYLTTFKRNGCVYVISFVGLDSSFQEDIAFFEQFLAGFQAP